MTNEELAVLIQQGHDELYPVLWENVSKLITVLAYRYYLGSPDIQGNILEPEDFAQSGYFALVRAVEHFDPAEECKFTTYLTKCLKTAFAETGGWRTSKTDALDKAFSLDTPISEDENKTFLDFIPDTRDDIADADDQLWREELRQSLDKAVAALGPKISEIIFRRYVREETLKDIAEDIGVTPESVRQLERSKYHKLRCNKDLRRFIDELTDYYARVGVKAFNSMQTSAVELLTLRRESMEQRFKDNIINSELDVM